MSLKTKPSGTWYDQGDINGNPRNEVVKFNQTSIPIASVTPDFKKKILTGEPLPMRAYSCSTNESLSPVGPYKYVFRGAYPANGSVWTALGTFPLGAKMDWVGGVLSLYTDVQNDVDARSTSSLYEAANNTDFQGLVSLGEAPKTLALIGQTATRLAGALRSLKRGDVSSVLSSLGLETGKHSRSLTRRANTARKRGNLRQFAADSWLEVKYGWKPMLSDIEAAAEATAKGWQKEPADIFIQAGKRRTVDARKRPGNVSYEGHPVGKYKYSNGYSVKVAILDPTTRNLQGLGLLNLASVAWELIPYSFVLDWFLPVGDFINAQTAFAGTTFKEGCQSSFHQIDAHMDVYEVSGHDAALFCKEKGMRIDRELLSQLPSTTKILNPTSFSRLMSFDRAITGLALLQSAYR